MGKQNAYETAIEACSLFCSSYPESEEDNSIDNLWARYGAEFAAFAEKARAAKQSYDEYKSGSERSRFKKGSTPANKGVKRPHPKTEQVRDLVSSGRTMVSVAQELGIPRSTVNSICKDIKKPFEHRGRKATRFGMIRIHSE